MSTFRLTHKALDDLIKIWDYSARKWSENQAEKYYRQLMSSCSDLAMNPTLGKSYEILSQNIFGFRCGEHIIFYRNISKNEIEIERILHQRMDLKNKI